MAPSIGLNLRVTGYCNQGGRKYMEDVFSVAYQQTEDEKDLEYAFFGIFDGHGGREAAVFAKEHLMDNIVRQKNFWSDDDESILKAIHEGFVETHHAMWKELEKWPRTASGLPSTAGTTASVAFIRRGKIYIGHVGDSAIVLGTQNPDDPDETWTPECLTRDHKPESVEESTRIQQSGGKVVSKSGVPRVVWNRPRMGHRGPVRRSTHIDEIPFLAVARALGDLWSYNSEEDVFVVSPEPDTFVYPIDITKHRCLILGTDGCWNMINPTVAVESVCQAERANEQHMLDPATGRQWLNPSKRLVDSAIEKWNSQNMRADNTSVVTVMLDPPGPPRAQVLKKQREIMSSAGHIPLKLPNMPARGSMALVTNEDPELARCRDLPLTRSGSAPVESNSSSPANNAVSIISRFPNARNIKDARGHNLADATSNTSKVLHDFQSHQRLDRLASSSRSVSRSTLSESSLNRNMKRSESIAESTTSNSNSNARSSKSGEGIQCNEITSSSASTASDDGDHDNMAPLTRSTRNSAAVLKDSSKLSRELSSLQLESPAGNNHGQKRGRTRSSNSESSFEGAGGQGNSSDTENEAPAFKKMSARVKNFTAKIAQRRQELQEEAVIIHKKMQPNPHFLRSKEAKVKKSVSLATSLPSTSSPTTSRSLRPRGPNLTPNTASNALSLSPSRKRKASESSEQQQQPPMAKSPRTVVHNTKPVMTRSRKARVLQLKK